jgi:hypothetical protein
VGLIRKAASVSTLGAVKYTSKREAQTKQAIAGARLANEQAKAIRAQNEPPPPDTAELPWWRQPTVGQLAGKLIQDRKDRHAGQE